MKCLFKKKDYLCNEKEQLFLRFNFKNKFFMKKFKFLLIAAVAMLFATVTADAQQKEPMLKLPSVVGSNMVLQHSTTVNIWGWAKPRATVKVHPSWLNVKKPLKVKANEEGFWILPVQTLAAGYTPYTITIKAGKEIKELKNIVFGEVWLCAGQSNMEWAVRKTPDMKEELENGANDKIRLYCTGRTGSATPKNDVPAQKRFKAAWRVCNSKSLSNFSAVAYGFGKDLQEALDVPIGLIDASFGGSTIEAWLSKETIAKDKRLASYAKKLYKRKQIHKRPTYLYNANIYPIRHTTVAGTIWYQGCSNVGKSHYTRMLNTLIKSWRTEFRNPEMPFYIVEIAPHTYNGVTGARIREAQGRVADRTSNCELVVTNDQNQIPGDIHPPKKWDVAHRLSACALAAHYKKSDKEFRSPAYESMMVEGNSVRVTFKNVPTTLAQSGEGRINGFQLGVQDPNNPKKIQFSVAEARIEGNQVVVWADGVTAPTAVRYCYNEDMGNVISAEGLPLRAFRSDKSNSASARPYVEKPCEAGVKFEGVGFTRTTFTEGAPLWSNHTFVVGSVYPKEFEGFELLVPVAAEKGQPTAGGRITAKEDGKIYIITFNQPRVRKDWKILTSTYSRCNKDGKPRGVCYVAEREVKAGEVVELPILKNRWGVLVLAKSIEY